MALFSQGTDLTAGVCTKALLAGYMPSALAKRLLAIILASLLANAQEFISFFLLSALLLNE